jgi:hypothetical protein
MDLLFLLLPTLRTISLCGKLTQPLASDRLVVVRSDGAALVFSPKELHLMASIFRRTYKRPIPSGAEIVTRKGQRFARWKDKRGRTKSAPLDEAGEQIVLEYRQWYIEYEGANGEGMELAEAVAAWTADLERRGKSRAYIYNMRLLMTRMADACRWPTLGSIRRGADEDGIAFARRFVVRIVDFVCGNHGWLLVSLSRAKATSPTEVALALAARPSVPSVGEAEESRDVTGNRHEAGGVVGPRRQEKRLMGLDSHTHRRRL